MYEEKALFAKVSSEIKKYKNLILVLPETDPVQSWQSTNRSTRVPEGSDRSKLNWHLISSPCNSYLATYTTYVNGRKPEEIADEIINHVQSKVMN